MLVRERGHIRKDALVSLAPGRVLEGKDRNHDLVVLQVGRWRWQQVNLLKMAR